MIEEVTPLLPKTCSINENKQSECIQDINDSKNKFIWDNNSIDKLDSDQRKSLIKNLKHFKWTEELSHSTYHAYGAPYRKSGEKINVTEPDGKTVEFITEKLVTSKKGLVGEILIPTSDASNNIYINWTGTHSIDTAIADLEIAPGEESFRSQEHLILAQINRAVRNYSKMYNKKVNLVITGHSLGGSLAQLQVNSLQRAIAENALENNELSEKELSKYNVIKQKFNQKCKENTQLKNINIPTRPRKYLNSNNINSITLGTWNSAGVKDYIESSSNKLSNIIDKLGVKQKAYFGMVGGDGVQTTGEGTVFSDVEETAVKVYLLKINTGCEYNRNNLIFSSGLGLSAGIGAIYIIGLSAPISGGVALCITIMTPALYNTFNAHTSKHFSEDATKRYQVEMYENNTKHGKKAINDNLTNKSLILQSKTLMTAKKQLHSTVKKSIDIARSGIHFMYKPESKPFRNYQNEDINITENIIDSASKPKI